LNLHLTDERLQIGEDNVAAHFSAKLSIATGSILISLCCLGSADRPAMASGFQDRAGSPDWTANAFAGLAAKGYDASTAWSNPAAMTLLSENVLDVGANIIIPSIHFAGVNTVAGSLISGSNGGNGGEPGLAPSGAFVWNASQEFKIGASLEAPFGQRLSYQTNFVGRYQALVSSVTDVELGLSAAYRINEHFSIGGGPIVDYFQARLTSAINTGPTAAFTGDPVADVHGNNLSAGYHLGALIEFNKDTRIGIDYRSRITHPINGSQDISVPPALAALSPATARLLMSGNGPANTRITVPDILTLSGLWDITPEWSALMTAQWTDWSLLQEVNIRSVNGTTTSLPLSLHSTWLGSVGANYRPAWAPGVMLQGGLGFDQSPATNSNRTPRLPGGDGILLAFGVAYAFTPNLKLQAAYLHEFGVGSNRITYSASSRAGILTGAYTNRADVISFGMSWSF
jgi:long-chain fatty acid transport protein